MHRLYYRAMLKCMFQNYISTSEGGSPLASSTPHNWAGNSLSDMANEFRNIYQLAAVVVHTGDAHSGHFITYRRGHQNSRYDFSVFLYYLIMLSN